MALGAQLSQYFNVVISSPEEAKKKVSIDVTKYIEKGISLNDEDGLIQEVTFDISEAYVFMDTFTIGMRVDLIGGTLTDNEHLFLGFIKTIQPEFTPSGDAVLKITAHSQEGKAMASAVKNLVFPAKNHPKAWAQQDISYQNIIENIAKDNGFKIGEFKVLKHAVATKKTPIKQHNDSDYRFIQYLAKKINCTAWISIKGGVGYLNLMDNSLLTNKIADHTFFYPARKSSTEFADIVLGAKQIQLIEAKITLAPGKTGTFKQITDPKTGETQIVVENKNAKGEDTENPDGRWVLDESMLRKLSDDERSKLIDLFMSGQITWNGDNGTVAAKKYFKYVSYAGSSREAQTSNTEVTTLKGEVKADGISSTQQTSVKTETKTYKTVIDEEKLKGLSSEEKSAVLSRIVRREMTDSDKEYYKTVDITPTSKDEETKVPPAAAVEDGKKKKKRASEGKDPDREKRDAGFKIEAKCYGDLAIKTKLSYVIEGLSKYSGKYYLYRVVHEWGNNGYTMNLTFVK